MCSVCCTPTTWIPIALHPSGQRRQGLPDPLQRPSVIDTRAVGFRLTSSNVLWHRQYVARPRQYGRLWTLSSVVTHLDARCGCFYFWRWRMHLSCLHHMTSFAKDERSTHCGEKIVGLMQTGRSEWWINDVDNEWTRIILQYSCLYFNRIRISAVLQFTKGLQSPRSCHCLLWECAIVHDHLSLIPILFHWTK